MVCAWLHVCIYLKTESPVFHWLTRKRFIVLQGQYPRDSISPYPATSRRPYILLTPRYTVVPVFATPYNDLYFPGLPKRPSQPRYIGVYMCTRWNDTATRMIRDPEKTCSFFKFQFTNITFTTKGEKYIKSNVSILIYCGISREIDVLKQYIFIVVYFHA